MYFDGEVAKEFDKLLTICHVLVIHHSGNQSKQSLQKEK